VPLWHVAVRWRFCSQIFTRVFEVREEMSFSMRKGGGLLMKSAAYRFRPSSLLLFFSDRATVP
jgi:hypothetical protein